MILHVTRFMAYTIKNCIYINHLSDHYNNKIVIMITIIIKVNNN